MTDRTLIRIGLGASLMLAVALPGMSLATDDRTAITLDPQGREFVLGEMRQYVVVLQQIASALARDDLQTVARSARSMGRHVMKDAPRSMMMAMPAGFRQLGMSVHMDFEQIAVDAESLGDIRHTLEQLGTTLGKCVACHEAYRLQALP